MNVLLVHGLGRTPCSLFGLASALRREGHGTRFFAYSTTLEPLSRIIRRLVDRLRRMSHCGEPVGLVGHSLGGLLLRLALVQVPELPVGRLIMLGTPNRGSRVGGYFSRWRPFRLFTRTCHRLLTFPAAFGLAAAPAAPYVVVAGTAGPRHPRYIFKDRPNDGIVSVEETRVDDETTPQEVPALHSFIMDHPAARALVLRELRG